MAAWYHLAALAFWLLRALAAAASSQYESVANVNLLLQDRATMDPKLPACAGDCVYTLLAYNSCNISNSSCFCSDQGLSTAFLRCITDACSVSDGLAMQNYRAETCGFAVRDNGSFYRRFTWGMFAVASVFIFGRMAARSRRWGGSGYSWDDWVILFCYALLIPGDVSGEIEVQNGLARDMYTLTVPMIVTVLKWFYIGELMYNIIVMCTKISMLLLYLRIWTHDSVPRRFRSCCRFMVWILTATSIIGAFVIIFQCNPVSLAWAAVTEEIEGECLDLTAFTYAYAALDIFFDLIVLSLPIYPLIKLDVSPIKRAGICSVFLVGFLVTVCSAIRVHYLVDLGDTQNITWDFQDIGLWCLIEINFSIVCCCMPVVAGGVLRMWLRYTDPSRSAVSKGSQSAGDHIVAFSRKQTSAKLESEGSEEQGNIETIQPRSWPELEA